LLLGIVAVAAVVLPAALAYLVWRTVRARGGHRVGLVSGVVAMCVVSQVFALVAMFLAINDSYGFYSSYGDLLGHSRSSDAITVNTGHAVEGGHFKVLEVHGAASHTSAQVLAWLPAQYDEPAYRHRRFPVVEFLPGQPNTVQGLLRHFDILSQATPLLQANQLQPFVLVVPPLMIRPPQDTECTDVPHGPQALAWLRTDVPRAVTSALRVDPPGRGWTMLGWSTGAFCAAKLLLTDPGLARAAVGLGGYYQPTLHHVYPNLFGGSTSVRLANDPQHLYELHGLRGDRLLLVAGQDDPDSWPSTRQMLLASRGDPAVSYVAIRGAGHNTAAYARYLGPALQWLGRLGA
jgi:pimeloyl-ACP methyl ester carboxylesterase